MFISMMNTEYHKLSLVRWLLNRKPSYERALNISINTRDGQNSTGGIIIIILFKRRIRCILVSLHISGYHQLDTP